MRRLAIFLVAVLTGFSTNSARAAEPVFTNKPRFRIPFKFDAAEMQKLQPREVQLHVSNDRGLRWQQLQSANPTAGKFDFEAPSDGEYWFGVKTLDSQNRLFPRDNTEPGLKVIVDTTQPNLELRLREVERGKVQLTWYADDTHLDPTTLRLEYMQTGANNWQQVSIVPQASGQTTWSVPRGGFVAVRGTVGDSAQNIGKSETQINVGAASSGDPDSDEGPEEYREPVANSKPANDPFAPIPGFDANSQTPAGPQQPGVPRVSSKPNMAQPTAPRPGMRTDGKYISDAPETRPNVLQPRRAPGAAAPQAAAPQVPAAVQHFVNNRSFQVGYRIDGADTNSVAAVELYVTRDDGAQWDRYGDDEDRTSPFPVSVPEDGIYGFRLRVRSATGPSSEPPKPGDKPLIVVTVDQTPPVAQLLPVQAGTTQNDLLIRWDVRDAHLGPTPISISVAATPAGPWKPIGGWQPNSGQFVWTPEPGMPQTTYLRLTAKDAAGNVTEIAPREAVMLSNTPRLPVRIIGVDPRSNSTSKQ